MCTWPGTAGFELLRQRLREVWVINYQHHFGADHMTDKRIEAAIYVIWLSFKTTSTKNLLSLHCISILISISKCIFYIIFVVIVIIIISIIKASVIQTSSSHKLSVTWTMSDSCRLLEIIPVVYISSIYDYIQQLLALINIVKKQWQK